MKTYGDVYLTENGYAKNEDGYVFDSAARIHLRRLVYGFGVNDFCNSTGSSAGGTWKPYSLWASVLERAYSPELHTRFPTYLEVEVEPSWHTFNAFLDWLLAQPFHSSNFQIDKDIIGCGKHYGPDDCLMVPLWVNSLLTDHGNARGSLPLGVCRHGKGFEGRVRCGTGKQVIKHFRTVEEASNFYHDTKQQYVDSRKEELDAIDERLYPNLCRILNERRMK